MRANWTAEEIAKLDELKNTHGPAEIAKIITTKTRSAISSRISRDRSKLAPDPFAAKEVKCGDKKEIKAKSKKFKRPISIIPIRLHPLDKIGANDCRWPIGDLKTGDLHFCGAKTTGIGPYCVEHTRVAFTAGTAVKLEKVV